MTFEQFVKEIRTYESDTFSAKGQKLRPAEAARIARKILGRWREDHLDGCVIDIALDEVRRR